MEAMLTRWTNDTITFLNEQMPEVKGGIGGTRHKGCTSWLWCCCLGSSIGVWTSTPGLSCGILKEYDNG